MVPAEQAFLRLRSDLEALLRRSDTDRLRDMLCGANLPALGNDYEPAELILRALEIPRYDHKQAERMARLAFPLVDEQTEALKNAPAQSDTATIYADGTSAAPGTQQTYWQNSAYLYNLFALSSSLPTENGLFNALHDFFTTGHKAAGLANGKAALQLRRALCNQQTDPRLQDYWISRLKDKTATWDGGRRTELMDAWRGILWRVDLEQPDSLNLLDQGLHCFHDTVAEKPEGAALLRHALYRFERAFPTSVGSGYLIEKIRPYWESWPGLLQDAALVLWPSLEPHALAAMPSLPPELNQIWLALSATQQKTVLQHLASKNAVDGRKYIETKLVFKSPRLDGIAPHEISTRLLALAKRLWPKEKTENAIQPESDPRDWETTNTPSKHKKAVDRLSWLESIGRTLKAFEQRLERGDEATAKRFLNQLITQQHQQKLADSPLHLAKTLSNAAAIVLKHGDADWSEELLRQAIQTNPNDVVPASGLADVLKAKGDLAAAEQQYRDNIAHWPNSDVSANGLAEVLKAKSDLVAAEQQYRDNIARWPSEVVSSNGLADVLKTKGDLAAAEQQYRDNVARWPHDRVSWNGLANVLRHQGRTAEALNVISLSQGLELTYSDLYDLHLKAVLLLDLGRLEEARAQLEKGHAAAKTSAQQSLFEGSLVMLELKAKNYTHARTCLASMPENVISLQLYRLHAAAGDGDEAEARRIKQSLRAGFAGLAADKKQVLTHIEDAFCLFGQQGMCQPDQAALDKVFGAEIEMELAA